MQRCEMRCEIWKLHLYEQLEASRADGISWGMCDDAIEETRTSVCFSVHYVAQSLGDLTSIMAGKDEKRERDELAESLNDLFTNLSTMVQGELQGSSNVLELLEKMNLKVAEEYKGYGDVAFGLRVFVEQLKSKSGSFDEYVQQIDVIEQQVTEFEAVISMLDKYVSLLESKVHSVYQVLPS